MESGTRLKGVFRAGADGSKSYDPFYWYDADKDVKCTFMRATDGVERCLPQAGIDGTASMLPNWFSDPACTSVGVLLACGTPAYATAAEGNAACGSSITFRVYEAGPQIQTYYAMVGPSCVAQSPPGSSMFAVGPEIPAAEFVATPLDHD